MNAQAELLASIADRLESAGIPLMVVGSVAGSFHGEPRTTIDVDIVIDPTPESLRRFVDSLPASNYYVSHTAALEAFARRTSFNVIHVATGGKVDLLVRRDRASRSSTSTTFGATSSSGNQRWRHATMISGFPDTGKRPDHAEGPRSRR